MTSAQRLIIGVDGGGTKTDAWLARLAADGGEAVIGKGRAGPSNPRAVGFEAAKASIETSIAAAFADAGLERTKVTVACLALAGAGHASDQAEIAAWAIERSIAGAVRVTTDVEPVLAAGSPENWGVALICGTG